MFMHPRLHPMHPRFAPLMHPMHLLEMPILRCFWKCLKSYRLVMHPTAPSPSFLCTPDAPNLIADRQSESACIYGSRKIDLILTKSISRFARNTVDCLEYVRQLKDLGIGVIFEKENINTLTMTSEFMIALYGSFAQAESESISKNVSFGVQMGFKEGKVRYNFRHLLGYKRGEDNMPVIVPEEAEIIRKIFTMFLDGVSMKDIAKTLERQGCKTKLGKTEWTTGNIRNILTNEKYVGDVLMQKTYTVDCITHKVAKNNGERTMYLASDCHPAIIDRNTYNLVQQELARRTAKRKVSTKTVTEQGKYSSKYALTELMICRECGTPYRRCTWNVHGRKQIVWRCISRLDHGSKYCKNSPTIHEEPLHRAIVQAINEFYDCGDDVARILKANVESVLSGMEQSEIQKIEQRLKDIDKARNDMISLITSGSCDEDTLDAEFAKLYEEETQLSGKLLSLKAQCKVSEDTKQKIDSTLAEIETNRFQLEAFDDMLIRKLIECVKVISKTEIIIIFKGGYEVKAEVEKK